MKLKLKDTMLESEMEVYLLQENYDVLDEEDCIDSVKVIDIAVDELGYASYRLDGNGVLNDTYLFVKMGVF